MSSTRLRKAFRYPNEGSDDDETFQDLDEEEQENFIERLKSEDRRTNQMYKWIYLSLPLFSAATFVQPLMYSSLQIRLISFLAISSLLCTAYILLAIPDPSTSTSQGSLQTYISYLNSGLSLLVGLNAFLFRSKKGIDDGFAIQCALPGAIFLIIVLARQTMLSVDIKGLEKLKFPYKGA